MYHQHREGPKRSPFLVCTLRKWLGVEISSRAEAESLSDGWDINIHHEGQGGSKWNTWAPSNGSYCPVQVNYCHTALRQWVNQSQLEMNRLSRVSPSLAYYRNNIFIFLKRIVISSLPFLNTGWLFWEGKFYSSKAVSCHQLISCTSNKSIGFVLQVEMEHQATLTIV